MRFRGNGGTVRNIRNGSLPCARRNAAGRTEAAGAKFGLDGGGGRGQNGDEVGGMRRRVSTSKMKHDLHGRAKEDISHGEGRGPGGGMCTDRRSVLENGDEEEAASQRGGGETMKRKTMNAKMALAGMLAAGLLSICALGQEMPPRNTPGKTRGSKLADAAMPKAAEKTVILCPKTTAGVVYEIQWTVSIYGEWTILRRFTAEEDGECAVTVALPEGACCGFFRVCSVEEGETCSPRNAVGFITFTIPAGGKLALSVPFVNLSSDDGLFRFGETEIAEGLPVGSSVLFWDADNQKWGGGMKSEFGWDPAEFDHVLMPGEGFCVMNPTDFPVEVIAAGEVPSDERISVEYCCDSSWSAMANPYPVEVVFEETALAQQLEKGSSVRFWNSTNQRWDTFTKNRIMGSWRMDDRVLGPGEAFFIQAADREPLGVWEVWKPYDWP